MAPVLLTHFIAKLWRIKMNFHFKKIIIVEFTLFFLNSYANACPNFNGIYRNEKLPKMVQVIFQDEHEIRIGDGISMLTDEEPHEALTAEGFLINYTVKCHKHRLVISMTAQLQKGPILDGEKTLIETLTGFHDITTGFISGDDYWKKTED
jgi:hypothetical protein